jgi:hypothetical protein
VSTSPPKSSCEDRLGLVVARSNLSRIRSEGFSNSTAMDLPAGLLDLLREVEKFRDFFVEYIQLRVKSTATDSGSLVGN